jgi:hypothetical protein
MLYNTQNDWVSGLYPSSAILSNWKTCFGTWICLRLQEEQEKSALLGSLERSNLSHLKLFLRDPTEQVSLSPRLKTKTHPVSETLCFLVI